MTWKVSPSLRKFKQTVTTTFESHEVIKEDICGYFLENDDADEEYSYPCIEIHGGENHEQEKELAEVIALAVNKPGLTKAGPETLQALKGLLKETHQHATTYCPTLKEACSNAETAIAKAEGRKRP